MGASLLAFGRMILVLGLIIGVLMVLARYGAEVAAGWGRRPGARSRPAASKSCRVARSVDTSRCWSCGWRSARSWSARATSR